jgi:aryl-alcohol dehydrogenase-like predicted oxidoreductase
VVAKARGRGPARPGGARHRLRPLQPARQGLPHRHNQPKHRVHQLRHPHHHPRFSEENRRANQALVDLLGTIAQRKEATPAQIALAWLLALKPWIVPIPGTRRVERLDENIGAAHVALTAGDLTEIETAAAQIQVHGARYPEHLERMTGL